MIETYTELANSNDIVTDNEKFNEYVNEKASGFGLAPIMSALAQLESAQQASQSQQVSGQKLEQVKVSEMDLSKNYLLWLAMLVIFLSGFMSQFISRETKYAQQ